jgi:anti-sigma B factor antagonist
MPSQASETAAPDRAGTCRPALVIDGGTPGFSVEPMAFPGAAGVTVRGEVDIHTTAHLGTALDDAARDSQGAFVVDLSDVEFLDSIGVATLVRMRAVLGREDRELRVVCPPGPVRRVLEMAGIADLLELVESREHAAAGLLPRG